MRQYRFIIRTLFIFLLLAGGQNSTWGATVTYHILTLPIDPSRYDYNMTAAITGWRLEAVKVVAKNQTTVELPAEYKSPLATGFTYYAASDINIIKYNNGTAQSLFDNGAVKGVLYKVNGVDADTEGSATSVDEGTTISGSTAEYYVVYTYNASNTIAKLDGSVKYNIRTKYKDNKVWKDRGFFALNRGRNNRPAVLPTDNVNPEMLASEDFMVAPVTGTGVSPYWKDNTNNKNKEADVAGQFHFMFKFEGVDPYNIIIRTTYNRPYTYIEKNEGTNDFVYKWYKEASLFAVTTGNAYIASDEHKKYKTAYNSGNPNPTDPASDNLPGYYHGHSGTIWNSVALLPNSDKSGYVFMATRAVDGNGAIGNTIYYLKQKDNCNNLNFASGNSTDNLSIEGLYPLKKVTFKVATPFYKVSATTDHIVSAPTEWVSQYTVDNDPIETKYLPAALKRKYCNFNGDFYSDAACTNKITKFSQATIHPTEGYQVYVGYDISPSAPKFLSPSASYTDATWYELTDEGSVQESGRKIKYDTSSSTYKNNGANGEYMKESEFAFVGDPYELKVLYRKGTETAGSNQYVTLSTYDAWDIPNDETVGSFLLRKFNDTGYWSWNAGQVSGDVTYGSDLTITPNTDKNAQTVTINLSGLNTSKYYKISTSGAGASQIVSVTPSANHVEKVPSTTMTVVVKLAENTSGADKTMIVTIQEYNDAEGNTPFGSSSDITITQGTTTSAFAGNVVDYSPTNSTRVKVLTLPTRTYTYNIVDKSGRIAVKASASQTIFSKLSIESIPSIIVSPFILDETVTFYDDNYVDGSGRGNLTHSIPETPNVADDIYVTYTTTKLINKPVKLNQEQEFNVVLNGQYLWYNSSNGSIETNSTPSTDDLKRSKYLWKLRNRDPYAMLIDNKGAREHLEVTGDEIVTMYDNAGEPGTETREKGAWVALASIANEGVLSFTKRRSSESEGEGLYAQRFVAKASTNTGVYEVMVATGAGTDASTTYYNIGRPTENTVKIYDNAHYAHGSDILKFQLEQTIGYVYHLIDKAKHELLTLTSQNPDLALPGDYQSPLVATYHFYDPANIKETVEEGVKEYEPKPSATELSSLAGLNATYDTPVSSNESTWTSAGEGRKLEATSYDNMTEKAKQLGETGHYYFKVSGVPVAYYYDVNVTKPFYNHIYVTYDANDRVKFKTGSYMLKFLEPLAEGYYLEDGLDKLTTSKIKAVYPYCNGDGNLNIYGDNMQKEQFNGGASTRPRWIWYFDSDNSDPYHVTIHSRSTISYNSISNPTYLTTYAVHFNQDAEGVKKVVTGGTLPGIASVEPTEYMVLGSVGSYKLMTTKEIDDGTTNERRKVTSLEQYWKNYNMIKLDVLGISNTTDAYSDDASTWVVPNTPLETTYDANSLYKKYNDTHDPDLNYRDFLDQQMDWHSYNAYANATRWNGYNDKTDGHEKKVVENIEHWFQTFDMGNGSFDIEDAEVPPVLVLLDLHGWEIMRLPLPTVNYPEGDDELAALRAYDSPMVDKYYFYSNATKASGCHKYSLRLNDKKEERDQIKVNGVHYSSTSLGSLPPINASGVKSSGAFNDQFVIYTVKEEYAKSYDYTFTDNGNNTYTESGTASKFLVLLRSRFLRYNDAANASYFSKPIYEASNPTGGNVYDAILDPQRVTAANVSTAVDVSPQDGYIDDINLWYVQPNQNIDKEMGIKYASTAGNTGEPWTEIETKQYYYDKGKAGFDPYNIQLKNAGNNLFVTSHQTSTTLDNGIMIGDYSGTGGTTDMTLVAEYNYTGWNPNTSTGSNGYDHTNLTISNQTFMAVSDANGNLQLMPRFDHTKRVNLVNDAANSLTTLQDPVNHPKASAEDNSSMGTQTAFFVRPQVFEYKIIDNDGNESLRYKRSGDFYPAVTEHFKSPLAKDFTYYTGLATKNDISNSTAEAWNAATGDFKRTLTNESMLDDEAKRLPTTGTYEYKIGTQAPFTYKKIIVSQGLIVDSDAEAWNAATGDFKRTLTNESMLDDAIKLLPTAGDYYYRIGTRGVFSYKKVTITYGLQEKQITGSFAEAGLDDKDCHVVVRYDYDANADHDGDRILEGKWFTVKLDNKDLQAVGTVIIEDDVETVDVEVPGTGVDLYAGNDKPATVDEDVKKWQWKFLQAPTDPSSDYYLAPDPYAIHLFNRYANYTTNPSEEPSPMAVGIKVPNANNGADRFALLAHPEGGYALAVAGNEAYTYNFVNGANMTTPAPDAAEPVAATIATETSFTQKAGIFDGVKSQLLVINDVKHDFRYKVVNNATKLAVEATQDEGAAEAHEFFPYLPEAAQTPLLRMKDYKYYGFATPDTHETPSDPSDDTYTVIPQTILYTLYGLYDDEVWVRYDAYDVDKTEFKVPNKRNTTGTGQVARDPSSVDVSLNINGELPYNIIWYNDNMMVTATDDATTIYDGGSQSLSGLKKNVWYIEGNDPYALKIRHKESSNYVNGTATLVATAADAKEFMLLKKSGYDYGILQETAGTYKLTFGDVDSNPETPNTCGMTTGDPTKFIIFGLSVHDLIYRLVIANTGNVVSIPYREGTEQSPSATLSSKDITGSTQRNLTSGTPAGATYQLGTTLTWGGNSYTYCHDAGAVSIGDDLTVPNVFNRPNCTFEFYIAGIYDGSTGEALTGLESKYKGLKLNKLMSDADLIDETVVVNIVYSFNQELATNNGMDFVRSTEDKFWYTFETQEASVPQLIRYTKTQGLKAAAGRETHYTNDYLWTPLGDVYGFKMYNRYTLKNGTGGTDKDKVMTTTALTNNTSVTVAEPSATYPAGNEIYELISGDIAGYFRVHPVANTKEQTQVYVKKDGSDLKLSTTPQDWTFGLDIAMLQPYYLGAGNVGGLNATGKALYKTEIDKGEGKYKITDIQAIVYNDDNIVDFAPGYYRLHSQPGVTGVSPARYASGYLHKTEMTENIPMHFYSMSDVTGTFDGEINPLESGFTETIATRGDIPVPATEEDPSTIFYITGSMSSNRTISNVTLSTQGLNVIENKMGTGTASQYKMMDIGGGVVLLYTEEGEPKTTTYLTYDQSSDEYDLKYQSSGFHIDQLKWCVEPANTLGLEVATNQGGDSHYYATFYAPYDVLLPDNDGDHTYYAYYCKKWYDEGLHPTAVPEKTIDETTYNEGKFVPAGTPVIIRTTDESDIVKLTLPTTSPTLPTASSISTELSGTYLEKLLPVDASHDVYTLGLPFTSGGISIDRSTGVVTAPLKESATTGVGFYINATPNKEHNPLQSLWQRNNRYVLHNKIYYRASSGVGGDARENNMTGIQFVPVIFGDEEEPDPNFMEQTTGRTYPTGVFDLQGRKVATEEEVQDGTWRQQLSPGIYIVNGKKVAVK